MVLPNRQELPDQEGPVDVRGIGQHQITLEGIEVLPARVGGAVGSVTNLRQPKRQLAYRRLDERVPQLRVIQIARSRRQVASDEHAEAIPERRSRLRPFVELGHPRTQALETIEIFGRAVGL